MKFDQRRYIKQLLLVSPEKQPKNRKQSPGETIVAKAVRERSSALAKFKKHTKIDYQKKELANKLFTAKQ